jgi:hypothetical protein
MEYRVPARQRTTQHLTSQNVKHQTSPQMSCVSNAAFLEQTRNMPCRSKWAVGITSVDRDCIMEEHPLPKESNPQHLGLQKIQLAAACCITSCRDLPPEVACIRILRSIASPISPNAVLAVKGLNVQCTFAPVWHRSVSEIAQHETVFPRRTHSSCKGPY